MIDFSLVAQQSRAAFPNHVATRAAIMDRALAIGAGQTPRKIGWLCKREIARFDLLAMACVLASPSQIRSIK